ncbi:hypothetical protein M441DRAFT_431145 [Trichoderma asperellum CBS 433.97]|uniref:Uncharacterized protein n=1 Tax=Trichoderma asperellum (strain ATCC 204424 / CBS 433.97 / NBRC 101777) TaxID=1042311 RepID=A0A2T3Z6E2_TRIA4|nr:hypothetical protein M441DRAFT_431145 [Trichoderma asperellum CBS 433.97]PTB40365.1 hypothetical protein M441DRAFT_431145 [Trichoderma asperellum CBS 433.97]
MGRSYRQRPDTYRTDRIHSDSSPRYTWPEDKKKTKKMGKEEALQIFQRAQQFERSVRSRAVTHTPTCDLSRPGEHNDDTWFHTSQPGPDQIMPDLENITDEVDNDIFEASRNIPSGEDSENDNKEVYTDVLEGVDSENDTEAYTDIVEGEDSENRAEEIRDGLGETEGNIAASLRIVFLCGVTFSTSSFKSTRDSPSGVNGDITIDYKTNDTSCFTCGIIYSSASVRSERSHLTAGISEYSREVGEEYSLGSTEGILGQLQD